MIRWRPARTRTIAAVAAASSLALVPIGAHDAGAGSDPVTVTFWNGFTGPDRPMSRRWSRSSTSSQDAVKVEMEISPWDQFYQRLLPSLASDDGPDLVAMDTAQLPQYVDRGVFRPMDDYYADPSTESDALVPAAVDAGKWDGSHYGVPMNFTTLLLYWNKGLFEAAGLDPETPPATWDDFIDCGQGSSPTPTTASTAWRSPTTTRCRCGRSCCGATVAAWCPTTARRRCSTPPRRSRRSTTGAASCATTGSRRSASPAPMPTSCSRPGGRRWRSSARG